MQTIYRFALIHCHRNLNATHFNVAHAHPPTSPFLKKRGNLLTKRWWWLISPTTDLLEVSNKKLAGFEQMAKVKVPLKAFHLNLVNDHYSEAIQERSTHNRHTTKSYRSDRRRLFIQDSISQTIPIFRPSSIRKTRENREIIGIDGHKRTTKQTN